MNRDNWDNYVIYLYIYTRILLVAIRIKSSWLSCRGVVLILLHTVVVCSLWWWRFHSLRSPLRLLSSLLGCLQQSSKAYIVGLVQLQQYNVVRIYIYTHIIHMLYVDKLNVYCTLSGIAPHPTLQYVASQESSLVPIFLRLLQLWARRQWHLWRSSKRPIVSTSENIFTKDGCPFPS